MPYFYIRSNPDWLDKYKYGYTKDLIRRYRASITEHSEFSSYVAAWQITEINYNGRKRYDEIISIDCREDRINHALLKEFKPFLVIGRSRNEFMKKAGLAPLIKIIEEYFPTIGLKCERLSETELRVIETKAKIFDSYQKLSKWDERDYQTEIINYLKKSIADKKDIYLELATGGGKSYIIYKTLSYFNFDNIIIFSPRKNINNQNINDKYISLLKNKYHVYNCSTDKNFEKYDKNIIIACSISKDKIYNLIQRFTLKNIFIWFDEAHHTIEKWLETNNCQYFLKNGNIRRIFTSASPNKENIKDIELYSPIKVKDLIAKGWLCPIEPYIFNYDCVNVNICNYSLSRFKKYKCSFGLSFHSLIDNAYKCFKSHYHKYINKETDIIPFLLVGKDYKDIDIRYKSIKEYEQNNNSIGYVVQMYSMGYDFKKIDYIIFSDAKTTYSDIIQCIGRGTRPDQLLPDGKNKNKKLIIMLPIFIDEEDKKNKYTKIVEVLKYLINDCGITYNEINNNFKYNSSSINNKDKSINYEGDNICDDKILELIMDKNITYKKFIKILKNNNIHNIGTYKQFIKNYPEKGLPINIYLKYKDFIWYDTYSECPYYSKIECKKRIRELKIKNNLDFDDIEDIEEYLNNLDKKIPPYVFFRFYGGDNNNEYIN